MSKIEWTDLTFNPVWGCRSQECDYCYAKNISKRFANVIAKKEYPNDIINQQNISSRLKRFEPTFLWNNFRNPNFPKKAKRIFVGSMSDIAFWDETWVRMLAKMISHYPQHTFQLLTKFPEVYKILHLIMPGNVWFGVTVTKQSEMKKVRKMQMTLPNARTQYISFEPLLSEIKNEYSLITKDGEYPFRGLEEKYRTTLYDNIDWIIVGTMSGRKRTPAKTEWVEKIVSEAKKYKVPTFVKQLEINGKLEKDIAKFPKQLQTREFPLLYAKNINQINKFIYEISLYKKF